MFYTENQCVMIESQIDVVSKIESFTENMNILSFAFIHTIKHISYTYSACQNTICMHFHNDTHI